MLGFDRFGGFGRFRVLGLLVGHGIDDVLVAGRKLLAQRHPMAPTPVGVRRRFSVRGQIT
jgi:hypothetical protein